MDTEKTFKTKTGFCHVLPDQIVLSRDGLVGNVAKTMTGNNTSRMLLIYGTLSTVLFYFSYDAYNQGQTFQPILFGLMGLYLVYAIINSRNNSATPIIDREKIKAIKLKKAVMGLTRSRFEVLFQDENGQLKKRLIMLPGSMTDGQNETEKALKIFKEEQLLD